MLQLKVSGSRDRNSGTFLYSELGASSRFGIGANSRERLASATYRTLSITAKVLISACGAGNGYSGCGSVLHCGATVFLVNAAVSGTYYEPRI